MMVQVHPVWPAVQGVPPVLLHGMPLQHGSVVLHCCP
jgi:hypothetical protein